MEIIEQRLRILRARINEAECNFGRPPGSVRLLAVSKAQPGTAIAAAFALGLNAFGENYFQEALAKQQELTHLPIEWHFIGKVQRNKTKTIARNFAWVHSLDRLDIAEKLNEYRPLVEVPLQVCIQVNVSGEESKSGVTGQTLFDLAHAVAKFPRLRLRGLMAIPAKADNFEQQRAAFQRVREMQQQLIAQGLTLDTLSMGMSSDLVAAIAEGATMVRVGTDIFGPRAQV